MDSVYSALESVAMLRVSTLRYSDELFYNRLAPGNHLLLLPLLFIVSVCVCVCVCVCVTVVDPVHC
jgi:hypothetical protein